MKRFLIGFFLVALAFALVLGCTAKESSDDATKAPAGTSEAEAMDTTSMDSAMEMADSMMGDSMMSDTSDMMEDDSGE